jgi:hypothetical protein
MALHVTTLRQDKTLAPMVVHTGFRFQYAPRMSKLVFICQQGISPPSGMAAASTGGTPEASEATKDVKL